MATQMQDLPAALLAAADALRRAQAASEPIDPLTKENPDLSPQDAYRIAIRNLKLKTDAGATVVGHKIGLTSKAVQAQLGVDEPDYGALLDDMQIADGASIDSSELIAPKVELELAFVLKSPLAGPGVSTADVRAATDYVVAAIEIVDSRVRDWKITLADTIADQASSARFVLGTVRAGLDQVDVSDVGVELFCGEEQLEGGHSSAVLGDPCEAVAWLANAISEYGERLEPGHIVLSGACNRMATASPGDHFTGRFTGLGEVSVSFSTTGDKA